MPMPLQPQRLAAVAAGQSRYFTGKPCKHGHVAFRHVSDSSCLACREDMKNNGLREWSRLHARRKRAEALAADPVGTREKWRAEHRRLRRQNPEVYRALDRKHSRLKRQRNPKAKLAECRARQAALIQRTPQWADLASIRAFYEATPAGMVVDHVVPLRGRTVCGLHVPENLQYLTPTKNLAKGNRFDDWNDEGTRD